MTPGWRVFAAAGFLLVNTIMAPPRFNPSGPEAEAFGAAKKFPAGTRHTWRETTFAVGSFSRFDSIFPANRVPRAPTPWPFARAETEPAIRYEFQGKSCLAEKLWQPIGAEADATWWVDTSGQEFPSMGFSATVRDYARLGRLLAHEGNWNGRSYRRSSCAKRPPTARKASTWRPGR